MKEETLSMLSYLGNYIELQKGTLKVYICLKKKFNRLSNAKNNDFVMQIMKDIDKEGLSQSF